MAEPIHRASGGKFKNSTLQDVFFQHVQYNCSVMFPNGAWVSVRPVRACVFARPTRTVHMVGMCVPAADDMMKPLKPALSEGVGGYNNNKNDNNNDINNNSLNNGTLKGPL